MKKTTFLLLIVICFYSCQILEFKNSESHPELQKMEEILPGEWNVTEIALLAYAGGYHIDGKEFYGDTILYDVGSIYIPKFSTDSLLLSTYVEYEPDQFRPAEVLCTFEINETEIPFSINKLFMSGEDVFTYLRDGYDVDLDQNSEEIEFFRSIQFFSKNNFLNRISDHIVRIENYNARDKSYVQLERVQ